MFLVSWPGGDWQATVKYVVVILAIYLAILWVTLVFWAYRDIRQRSRDPVIQAAAVLLVLLFFLPGHWVYLILRPRYTLTELYERSLEEEALLQDLEDQKACPTCKRRVLDDYLICPSCRTQLKEPCRNCGKPLSYAWVSCPYCAVDKPAREMPRPARPPGPRPTSQPAATAQRAASRPRPAPQSAAAYSEPQRDPFAARRATDDAPIIDSTSDAGTI